MNLSFQGFVLRNIFLSHGNEYKGYPKIVERYGNYVVTQNLGNYRKKLVLFVALFSFYSTIGMLYTHPLILHINEGIPLGIFGDVGHSEGSDQLQLYFLSWLFKDNLINAKSPFQNPYIFSVSERPFSVPDPLIPLVFLTAALSVFANDVLAFNIVFILLSFPATGIVMYVLIKHYTENRGSAFLGGLIFTLVPFRLDQMLGGHINGALFFTVPLIIYLTELSFEKSNAFYAGLAGLVTFSLCFLEWHLIYYALLFLIIFIIFKILVYTRQYWNIEKTTNRVRWVSHLNSFLNIIIGISSAAILLIIYFGGFHFSILDIDISMRHVDNPIKILLLCIFIKLIVSYQLKFNKNGPLKIIYDKLKTVMPLIFFCLFSVGYMLFIQFYYIDLSSATEGGRSLSEVAYYSPRVSDIFNRMNGNIERYIYVGIAPCILLCFIIFRFGISRWLPFKEKESGFVIGFYIFIFAISLILALGTSLDSIFPLYKVLYQYLPFFNNQRVPSRIVIITFTAVAILSGFVIKMVYERVRSFNLGKICNHFLLILLTVSIALGIFLDFYVMKGRGIAIHILDKDNRVYQIIKEDREAKVLEIPLFNGQYHFATSYMYYVSITGARIINGYAGSPPERFLTIFKRLEYLNYRPLEESEYQLLKRLKVKYIMIHEKYFPNRVYGNSPIVPIYNFMNSNYVEFINEDKGCWLFSVLDKPKTVKRPDYDMFGRMKIPDGANHISGWYPPERWGSGVMARRLSENSLDPLEKNLKVFSDILVSKS